MLTDPGPRPSFAPRNWPGWLVVGLLWLLGQSPPALVRAISHPLGWLMRVLMGSRRKVAQRNLERCFPELNEAQIQQRLRANFIYLARSVFEMAWSWAAPQSLSARIGQVHGMEYVTAARQNGRGILCVSLHNTCMGFGANIMGVELKRQGIYAAGIYRPFKNPVAEWFQNRGRLKFTDGMISKRNLRSAVRQLKQGTFIWYAPDQDFGPDQTAFAPFFGIQTASLLATHKLAKLTGCAVVPMYPLYNPASKRYEVTFQPALEDFPSDDEQADLVRINQLTEDIIRLAPEQYWWVHRRFKTRPPGEPPFYS
jgi:KDO2-lipid IV(A) lauroyltransferase